MIDGIIRHDTTASNYVHPFPPSLRLCGFCYCFVLIGIDSVTPILPSPPLSRFHRPPSIFGVVCHRSGRRMRRTAYLASRTPRTTRATPTTPRTPISIRLEQNRLMAVVAEPPRSMMSSMDVDSRSTWAQRYQPEESRYFIERREEEDVDGFGHGRSREENMDGFGHGRSSVLLPRQGTSRATQSLGLLGKTR